MLLRVSLINQLLIVFQFLNLSTETEFEFVTDDEWFFSKCKVLPGVLDINGMFDMSKLNLTLVEEGIIFSGNMTTRWPGLAPSDRIQMASSVQYFDRGTWVPTILNMLIRDVCKVMFDEKQVWYKPWSSHIINRKDVENKCFQVPGTVFIFETFTANFRFGSGIAFKPGRYLIRTQFAAYDEASTKRLTEVCYDMTGQFLKV